MNFNRFYSQIDGGQNLTWVIYNYNCNSIVSNYSCRQVIEIVIENFPSITCSIVIVIIKCVIVNVIATLVAFDNYMIIS